LPAIVKVAPGVFRIPTAGDFINTVVFIEDDGSVTLIDCGLKSAPKRIVDGLAAIGKHAGDVQRIVLTHAHNDHAGGAADMVRRTGVGGVDVHADDAAFIESGRGSPTDQSTLVGRIFTRAKAGGFEAVPVGEELTDGQLLEVAGGLRIHHTPGHSPGHISLVHEPTSVMITGDAIWNMAARMTWPVAAFCSSHRLNQKSAHVLGELDYQVAVFTHGPHIDDGAREQVRGFLKRKDAW
jgi:glyoxylase-like metal-dependent hydrolase (beta-lactamase superfamily II)